MLLGHLPGQQAKQQQKVSKNEMPELPQENPKLL